MKKTLQNLLTLAAIAAVLTAIFLGFNKAPKTLGDTGASIRDSYAYVNTNNSTSVVDAAPGVLHSLVVNTVGAASVITLYDTNTSTIINTATGTITIGLSTSATSTATGTISAVINGLTVTSASMGNGSTTVQAATALTTAINASTSVLGVTATSTTTNVVTLTATLNNQFGNVPLGQLNFRAQAVQNGLLFQTATNLATPIIGQITTPATTTYYGAPQGVTYDAAFSKGLTITQGTATSTFTVTYQ